MGARTGVFNAVHAILICIVQNTGRNEKRHDRFVRGLLFRDALYFYAWQSEINALPVAP